MVDVGFSLRQVEKRLSGVGGSMERVRDLLVTHEHTDHVRGLSSLVKRFPISLHMTEGTAHALSGQMTDILSKSQVKIIRSGRRFAFGSWTIDPFSTPHDAEEPVGFVLESGGIRLGIATDIGEVQCEVMNCLAKVDALILEFNHDPDLLASGPYPSSVKSRIAGAKGHLANEDAGIMLGEIAHNQLQAVVLAHLSKNNNDPDLARSVAKDSLRECSARVLIADQKSPCSMEIPGNPKLDGYQQNLPML